MIDKKLKSKPKCYVCGAEAVKKTHFCSNECAEYYMNFLCSEMLREHIIQNVMKKGTN